MTVIKGGKGKKAPSHTNRNKPSAKDGAKKKGFQLYLTPEQKAAVKRAAAADGRSMSNYIVQEIMRVVEDAFRGGTGFGK